MTTTGEITASIGVNYNKIGIKETFESNVFSVDVTGVSYSKGVINLDTSYESLPTGDIATIGICVLENIGTDSIDVHGLLSGGPSLTLKPGEAQCFRPNNSTFPGLTAKAANTTSQLRFLIFED